MKADFRSYLFAITVAGRRILIIPAPNDGYDQVVQDLLPAAFFLPPDFKPQSGEILVEKKILS